MVLIHERNEWLANKLVNTDSDMMFAAVIVGNNPGKVWVDNILDPSSALVWSSGLGAFNFMGTPSNPYFNQSIEMFIDKEIIPFLRNNNKTDFEFSVDSEDWYPAIYQIIGKRSIKESFQYVYKSDNRTIECLIRNIPEAFCAVEINETFIMELNKGEISNVDFMINYIEQYWGNLSNFIGKGYGYVALNKNKEIVSIAISSFVYHSTHAIGVETLEGYKRLGLSSNLVNVLLKKFNKQSVASWWDCMDSNIASQKTAERAGLYKAHHYKISWFDF